MSIVVSLEVSPRRRAVNASELEEFARCALVAMKVKRGGFGILITGNAQLKQLNRRFRGRNKPTDVLSFPAVPLKQLQTAGFPYIHTGDIAISADIAAQNALSYGHSLADEIRILILHGILHLNGYDHESDRGEMEERETELRKTLSLPPALIQRSAKAKRTHKKTKTAANRRNSLK